MWTTNDSLISFLFFCFVIGLRWVIFSGPGWGKKLLIFLVIPVVLVMYRQLKTNFFEETLAILAVFLFASVCVWLARWPSIWLAYLYKVVRGAAKTAKKKADAMAQVE